MLQIQQNQRLSGRINDIRSHYHEHVCERFVQAFADNCGNWCKRHGIALTGHVMEEATLKSQTSSIGETMRSYRGFGIPGMDMLCARFEFTTAKQTQSAVHQYGKEGMLSELYGVTGWDFDFRGHKLHGDWQAALGVTVRVPHLAWVSMEGEAKRDYPASIHYQSPWWERYSIVEDHFARVNTAMTRGEPVVRVGVIHPIESYWLHFGPAEQTATVRDNMDDNFQNLTKWLLFGCVDFDYISESLLPELCHESGAPLRVGQMEYDMILVAGCETLRSTTLEKLEAFVRAGGRLVFAGDIPKLEDSRFSERGKQLAKNAVQIQFSKDAVLEAVKDMRMVELRNETGAMTDNLLHQIRKDGDGRWLFIAHGAEPRNKHISEKQDVTIRIKGSWRATIYNTMSGKTEVAKQSLKGNVTEIYQRMYSYDSLLLWLEPLSSVSVVQTDIGSVEKHEKTKKCISLPNDVMYTLSEPNALLLDRAEYALDGGEWQEREEILRLDVKCRRMLGWSTDIAHVAQPWSLGKEREFHRVSLRFVIESTIQYEGALLAIEKAEKIKIKWNNQAVDTTVKNWYVDKAIKTIALPRIEIGVNVLEVEVPIGKRTMIEWAYLLGDFGVEVSGKNTKIVPKRKRLSFGDITTQGLPFYTGNITYHIPIETEEGDITVRSEFYEGAMQEVSIDEKETIPIIYPPYKATFEQVDAGEHWVNLTFYGTRQNGFGPLHLADEKREFLNPSSWRLTGDEWCYEYMIRRTGVLVTPEIIEER